jgi:hypothetical protein
MTNADHKTAEISTTAFPNFAGANTFYSKRSENMSVRNGLTFCDKCKMFINPRSQVRTLNGNKHYHDRHSDDCWNKKVKEDEITVRYAPT